jgi:DNA polymerase I-like protein with 3'-5' exonuclease and polymerase domains
VSRHDLDGLFWTEAPKPPKGVGQRQAPLPRVMPPIPQTGWEAPTEFPRLEAANVIAIDLETYDPDIREKGPGAMRDGYIAGLAVGTDDGHRWYFPMRHSLGGNLDPETVLRWARNELCRKGQPKVGAKLMYDLEFLAVAGVPVEGPFWDVQFAEPLLDENARSYALGTLAKKYLGESKVEDALYDWCHRAYGGTPGRRQAGNIWRAPVQLVGPYAEGDVDLPLRIFARQKVELERQGLMPLFEMECALIPMLLAMRLRGVRADVAAARALVGRMTESCDLAAREFGISPSMIWAAEEIATYCKKRGIEYPKTAGGKASFTQDWLAGHADPALRSITEMRKWTKARDTFVQGYVLDCERQGRIHCQFHPLRSDENGTVSGRFSSSGPNLQNIPTRDEEIGPMIRSLFLPDEGEDWGSLDWSQIEFRLLCHYAQGEGADLVRSMFNENPTVDFHQMTAELTGVARKYAKSINFGLVYGMGEKTMADNLGRPLDEVKPMFGEYHERLPFVKHTYNMVSNAAAKRGWVRTIGGRLRRFDLWEAAKYTKDKDAAISHALALEKYGPRIRRAYTHKALNALLQGGAADMMKMAMLKIWQSGVCDVLGAPLLTVHDELDWSVPRTAAGREAFDEVRRIMETTTKIAVPVLADSKLGANWSEAK